MAQGKRQIKKHTYIIRHWEDKSMKKFELTAETKVFFRAYIT